MKPSRLSFALDSGAVVLPDDGPILVIGPRSGDDLSSLPRDRVRIVQGFRPDHDHFAAQGYATAVAPEGVYTAAVVCVPRARDAARARVAQAVAHVPSGATVVVDGAKTDGVDALLREIRGRADPGEVVAKAHGKVFAFAAPAAPAFDDWRARPRPLAEGFVTLPGIFSADGIDEGSRLLAAALPSRLPARVADLGAGWGFLSAAILQREGVVQLDLIEADHDALACARQNITDPRARFHWADATRFVPETRFDLVVTNPPFHTTRGADPALGTAFIEAAGRMLAPSGALWLVANRHLPYERSLGAAFQEVAEHAGNGSFKILRAARPVAARSKAARQRRRA
jgi:16S rRNA (guanine1207-N2)-methyltransferase